MKALFISTLFPCPPDTGGKLRTFNLLKETSRCGEVHLLTFYSRRKESVTTAPELSLRCQVHLVPMEGRLNQLATAAFGDRPLSIAKYRSVKMAERIHRLQSKHGFDLVYFDHLHVAQYRECVAPGIKTVLDEHNVESIVLARAAEYSWGPKRWVLESQAKKMRAYEAQVTKRFDLVTTVSEVDRRALGSLSPEARIQVVPNGVDTEFFSIEAPREAEWDLVFTGSMDWLPNEDAIFYFANQILPRIMARAPLTKLLVVGRNPSPKLLKLGRRLPVHFTGAVPDVREYVRRSKVFVVPLRIGGGTRLKILEALAMGSAVISTSLGCEGLDTVDGEHLLVADDPEEFACKTVDLIRNPELRRALGSAGRNLVVDRYTWSCCADRLFRALDEVFDSGKR
ncbi:MAG: glycosyltransferase family 4 protein [Bacillota bacterium]|nr:glycosyltransferase family 4 protein [Bacillota bacterium]